MKRLCLSACVLLIAVSTSVFAAPPTPNAVPNKPTHTGTPISGPIQLSRQQLELQLQGQELQLEQQLLQVRQQLFRLRQQDALQNLISQPTLNFRWVDASNGKVSADAVVGADAGGKPLYMCHANYMDGLHPGQVVDKGCLITYGGHAILQTSYQVLTSKQKAIWKPSRAVYYRSIVPMPYNPLEFQGPQNFMLQSLPLSGGFENGHPLYICRAMFENQIHLGKVVSGACNIGVDNLEVRVLTYEVLFN